MEPAAVTDDEASRRPVLPADDPQAYLAIDRRQALTDGVTLPDRVRGAGLFADISGFTPLTEALAADLGPQRGAEEVTAALETVFTAVLEQLHGFGGDVIYFSGDAVTCWLDGDDGERAVAAGLAMQEAMAQVGRIETPSGRVVELGMKVAVAVGPARRFVVGDHRVQLIDVLAGALVDRLADAEHEARIGEVVLDATAVESLGDRVLLRENRAGGVAVVERLARRTGEDGTPVAGPARQERALPPPLPDDIVRQWLLPPVYERMRSGRGELLAELRPAVPLFLRFGGIDYDDDEGAAAALDDFVVRAQRIVESYGGHTLQLTLGDKGAYLYAVFGSPVAHEDDAARACAAGLELRGLEGTTAAQDISIGIAAGRLRSGTYGHPARRTFCCLGDDVNLAARLMSAAGTGEILVSGRPRQAAGARFAWENRPPLAVKGKSAPVDVFALTGAGMQVGGSAIRLTHRFDEPMLGRLAELEVALDCVESALDGQGRVLDIVAEAGLGKSRLLAEVTRRIAVRGIPTYVGESPAFGSGASYAAWRDVWWDLLDLGGTNRDELGAVTSALVGRLEEIDETLVGRLPLLGPLLDVALPDNDLTRDFDGKLRKASLEDLLSTLLGHRARSGPFVIGVEDSHWMDPLSRDLLVVLAQQCLALPVVLVLSHRPISDGETDAGLGGMPHVTRLDLPGLEDEVVRSLVDSRVRAARGNGVPQAVVERIVERAQGNPFYVEELVGYLLDRNAGSLAGLDADALELPDSLSALVLSRVDTLAEQPRSTVKVASVIGRSFTAPLLHGVHPDLGPVEVVEQGLDAACAVDLVVLDDPLTRLHAFRHVIVRDVTYESIPFAVRTRLHERAGDHLAADGGGGDQLLDLLAYHYGRGGDEGKKRTAYLAAAKAAQTRYANATAIEHYRAVLPLLEAPGREAERIDVLTGLGQVLQLTGAWGEAEEAFRSARAAADAAGRAVDGALAGVALADLARRQGRFPDAERRLEDAEQRFSAAGDEAGIGRVLHIRGTLLAQQGRYDEARTCYEQSLVLRERLGDRSQAAALLSNLGVLAEYAEDYVEARRLNEAALALRSELGDRIAIGVSQNNLGMIALLTKDYEGARQRFTEAMRLNLEVGDAWMVAIVRHNLANALRGLGDLDAARRGYAQALVALRRFDDAWALAILLEDVAMTASLAGDAATAARLVGAAETAREAIGSPRTPSVESELAAAIGDAPDAQALAVGRALDTAGAVDAALAFCGT